jgi:AraC-like DNA-binding protein
MKTLKVKSLPIKDVITNLADELNTTFTEDCEIYSLDVPSKYGSGYIVGANFPNGVAWIQYMCTFHETTEIHFTVDEVHPLKLLYNLGSSISHSFHNTDDKNVFHRFQNIVVASDQHHGHILTFEGNTSIRLNSVEIDREVFNEYWACDIQDVNSSLKKAIADKGASVEHYITGSFSLKIAQVFQSIKSYNHQHLIRKMFLASKSFELIALQLHYVLTPVVDENKTNFETLELFNQIEVLLEDDLSTFSTVRAISSYLGVSEAKLQKIFKEHTDKTGNEYIKEKRMGTIIDYLENTDLGIGDIAKIVGIDSTSYLSKIFKERFNISPNSYRRQQLA